MNLLKDIIYSGISKGQTTASKRGTIITNYLSLILSVLLLLLYLYRLIIFDNANLDSFWLLGVTMFLLPLGLNRLEWSTSAKLALCYAPVCFLWYAFISVVNNREIIEISMYDGLRLFLVSMGILPYLVLDRSKPLSLLVGILPTLISMLFFDQIMSSSGLGVEENKITSIDYGLMPIRTFLSYSIISSGCFLLQYIIYKNDKFNQRLVSDLKNKTEELKFKNQELINSQSRLSDLNVNLENIVEQKTENIKKQNEALIKYAYTNAHQVRGPIARILGLIQISKLEEKVNYHWLFEKVKTETEEVDSIVKNISKDLNAINLEKLTSA